MTDARLQVGGQAVLEGVMMRSPRCFAVAVRRKSGEIVVREQPWDAPAHLVLLVARRPH